MEGIANFVGFSKLNKRPNELVPDSFMNINPRGSTTDLSLIVEPKRQFSRSGGCLHPIVTPFDSLFNISILKNNTRTLAAKFKCNLF